MSERFSPERIRSIRLELGLSQEEAGTLLGGGPRAFQKYETGEVAPSAALEQLLLLLIETPKLREKVIGDKAAGARSTLPMGLAVSEGDIERLTPTQLQQVLDLLVRAEMNARGLERGRSHVPSEINAPDGGEDGRVEWMGGPSETRYFPARLVLFQSKATSLSAAKCALELMSGKKLKARIAATLSSGGAYVLVISRGMTQKDLDARLITMRSKLAEAGQPEHTANIHIYSATQLVAWVNEYPAVAITIREMRGEPTPFRSFEVWRSTGDHTDSLVDDPRQTAFAAELQVRLSRRNGVARVVGPSGIGKSRLAIETFRQNALPWSGLRSKVLFVDLQGAEHDGQLRDAVQRLIDERVEALLVIENCLAATHNRLMAMVGRDDSRLSLLTLDMESDGTALDDLIKVEPMPSQAIADMTFAFAPHLGDTDRTRMVEYAQGYPLMVHLLRKRLSTEANFAWMKGPELAKSVALGRDLRDKTAFDTASIIALFGLVRIDGDKGEELARLHAEYGAPSPDEFRRYVKRLIEHGSVQRRGGLVMVTPRPVALDLARERWLEWSRERVAMAVTQYPSKRARRAMLGQLSRLDKDPAIQGLVGKLLAAGEEFDNELSLLEAVRAEAVSAFAEITPAKTVALLARLFGKLGAERVIEIEGEARRAIVYALGKLAFRPETFEEAAWLMLMLAEAENEHWGNNATGCFKDLFPIQLADTAAGLALRGRVIDRAMKSNDPKRLLHVVRAVDHALETGHFSRSMGTETQGSALAMESWCPRTYGERDDYLRTFLRKITFLAQRNDEVGRKARSKLGKRLFGLISVGLIADVEQAVTSVQASHPDTWLAAIDSLRHLLRHPSSDLNPAETKRVRALIESLKPKDLRNELLLIVSKPPWDWEADGEGGLMSPRDVMARNATELAKRIDLNELRSLLPEVLKGEQRQGYTFGLELVKAHGEAIAWIDLALTALRSMKDERNIAVLLGMLAALAATDQKAADRIIDQVSTEQDLLWIVPSLVDAAGVAPHRMPRLVALASSKSVDAERFRQFGMGRALDNLSPIDVSPLLIKLFENGGDYWPIALDLLGMYVFGHQDRLGYMDEVLRTVYATVGLTRLDEHRQTMSSHHFGEITSWVLSKGENNETARFAAIKLAETLRDQASSAEPEGISAMIKGTIRTLFRTFGPAIWPIVGSAALDGDLSATRLRFAIRGFEGHSSLAPTILELPETLLMTWCKANTTKGPAFVASVLPVLSPGVNSEQRTTWHPFVRKLIDEFGDEKELRDAILSSMYTFTWSGSLTTYYGRYLEPFDELKDHPIDAVRLWAQIVKAGVEAERSREKTRDDERDAIWKS